MTVQLLFFGGCPNAEATRAVLRQALSECGRPSEFEELDVGAPQTPPELRDWGSPTILVDGRDVGGLAAPTGSSCRLYPGADGSLQGFPRQAAITAALRGDGRGDGRGGGGALHTLKADRHRRWCWRSLE